MNEKVGRRWFRFSLRTMFVVVTVFCCWLGWETSVVRQRRALLSELQAKGFQFTAADEWAKRFPLGGPVPPVIKVPLVRGWLGDEAIQEIWFTRHVQGFSESELSRVAKVFPEAKLLEAHPEPCHPGCFPRGTLVETPQGPRPIERIHPGDSLIAILPGGESVTATVQSVFVTDNRIWKVETDDGVLFTTETQPLCLAVDRILPAGKLKPTDMILRFENGNIRAVKVLAVSPTDRTEKVFNLVLGNSEVFVAEGYLARSKPPAEIAGR